jgi:hypothetical protein
MTVFLFVVLTVSVAAWLLQVHRITRQLRGHHPEMFAVLGRPHLIKNNTPSTTTALLGFVLGKRDEPLKDPVLSRLCRTARASFYAALVSFIAVGVAFLVAMSTR